MSQLNKREPLLEVRKIKKFFPLKKKHILQRETFNVKAVEDVNLTIYKGETLGLVGESGCGKSTLGRVILQLYPPTSGSTLYYGIPLRQANPNYVIRDIERLPKIQEKAAMYYSKAVEYDKLIEGLKEQLKSQEHVDHLAEIEDQIKEIKEEIASLKAQRKDHLKESKEALNASYANYLEIKAEKDKNLKEEKVVIDKEVNEILSLMKDENQTEIINLFKALPFKTNKVLAQYKDVAKTSKKIATLEDKINAIDASNQEGVKNAKVELTSLKNQHNEQLDDSMQALRNANESYFADKEAEYHNVKRINVEDEVNHLLGLLEEDNQSGVVEFIKLLPIANKDLLIQYKKVSIINKAIDIKNARIRKMSTTKLDRDIERYTHKSKECKKEASRQLREGSETCGEFILEKDIEIISQLMLEEELAHREAFALSNELKVLSKNPTVNVERISEINVEIEKLRAEQARLLADLERYHFKDPQPITERCLDPEYQQKMESNRQFALNLQKIKKEEMRRIRHKLQIIFQDPYSSLDPRMTVGQAISEAVVEHGMFPKGSKELENYVIETMAKCGLDHYMIHRYPHQFSGGQRQRIVIARALALQPEFVVCDESVSALDVSIQSQILNLLEDLKEKNNLTYLFISHDLSVIKHISDRIGVMYLGNIVELCNAEDLYENSLHPYSKALISAIPTTSQDKKERIILEGDIPSNIFPPSGCKFRTRCPLARELCAKVSPKLEEVEPGHMVACHFYEETKSL